MATNREPASRTPLNGIELRALWAEMKQQPAAKVRKPYCATREKMFGNTLRSAENCKLLERQGRKWAADGIQPDWTCFSVY